MIKDLFKEAYNNRFKDFITKKITLAYYGTILVGRKFNLDSRLYISKLKLGKKRDIRLLLDNLYSWWRGTCTSYVHCKYLRLSLELKVNKKNHKDTSQDHQEINPFHQWIALYALSDSYKPGPPTHKAIQLLLNHLKKFYLIVRLRHLII